MEECDLSKAAQSYRETGIVIVQSPLEYPATLTSMESRTILAMVDAIAEAGVTLPGVNGDATVAAIPAGQCERCKSAATPF
jgi:hypothetical protein